jgi:hypothetical protein
LKSGIDLLYSSRTNRGRIVIGAAVACIFCGLIATASIMLTPKPAVSSAPSVDVSELASGQYTFSRHPIEGAGIHAQSDILFIRGGDDKLLAFHIPLKHGVRHAPDNNPLQPGWPCQRLEAQVSRGLIECESVLNGEQRTARWDLSGRGIAPTSTKLGHVTGHEESGAFLIHP